MFFECLQERGGHGLVVLAGVPDVGEYLGEGVLVVDAQEFEVLREVLLVVIILVDVGGQVVAVGLVVYEAVEGQAVGEWRLLVGPSHGEGGYGHDETGELEDVDDLLGLIDGGAQVAVAEPFLVHEVAERLGVEQCVGGSIDERQEVVVARLRLSAACPGAGAVEVGADGEHHRCLGDHGLVEVGWRQPLLHVSRTGYYYGVQLQVAHGLCAGGLGHQSVQQLVAHFSLAVLAYGTPCC